MWANRCLRVSMLPYQFYLPILQCQCTSLRFLLLKNWRQRYGPYIRNNFLKDQPPLAEIVFLSYIQQTLDKLRKAEVLHSVCNIASHHQVAGKDILEEQLPRRFPCTSRSTCGQNQ